MNNFIMATSKEKNNMDKKTGDEKDTSSVNKNKRNNNDELDSDGSGDAFEQTEEVNEDNFDDLKEK